MMGLDVRPGRSTRSYCLLALLSILLSAVLWLGGLNATWAQDTRVSLTIKEAPVDALLHQLADQAGVALILAEPIEQRMTVSLTDQPIDQVLDLVVALAGLRSRHIGGVRVVATPEYWSNHDQSEPLVQHTFELMARDVSELVDVLSTQLSPRGKLKPDLSANRLWVQDTKSNLEAVSQALATLDQPVSQVLIESRIVIANRDFNRALGLRFGVSRQEPDIVDGVLSGARTELAAANATAEINVSLLSARYRLDAELSALEASGQGRVISSPRIMVANRAEAFIQQGVAVPFEAVQGGEGTTGAVSVQFKEAVLALKTTPLILSDGRIQLDLNITQDTVGQIFQTGRGGSVPSIDTRALGTRVWVNDGQTLVLGGIFQEQDNQLMASVPGLSQIPGLGRLFQRNSHEDQRRELLIFITPTLLP